jgi:uncharacterized membrane protein
VDALARGLGWFSIGLGLAEALAPRGMQRLAGVKGDHDGLVRMLGFREIAHGIGILSMQQPSSAVWTRVGGDAIDLAGLGAAFASPDNNKARLTAATAAVAGVTALDVYCAQRLTREANATSTIRVKESVAISRPPEEVYAFWHDFSNLPRFMAHLESVRMSNQGRSHWVAKAPGGTTVEWDAETTEDRPNELIAWRSVEGSQIPNRGTVRFERAPGNRGTLVHVDLEYEPPGGGLGAMIAKLFGEEPAQQVRGDLRRLRSVIETGEVIKSDATIYGTGITEQRPGQPPGEPVH